MPKLTPIAILTVAVMLSGCAVEPRIFAFDYHVEQYTPSTQNAIVSSLSSGTNSITDFLPDNTCSFIADFSNNRATTTFNGDPGQSGFNIELRSVNANSTSTASPATCAQIESLEFLAGAQSVTWGAGDVVDETALNGEIGGEGFSGRHFLARLITTPSRNYVTGTFEFVAETDSGLTIIGTGPFSLKD